MDAVLAKHWRHVETWVKLYNEGPDAEATEQEKKNFYGNTELFAKCDAYKVEDRILLLQRKRARYLSKRIPALVEEIKQAVRELSGIYWDDGAFTYSERGDRQIETALKLGDCAF